MKKENLTEKEAWIAMVDGKCISNFDGSIILKLSGGGVWYWNPSTKTWDQFHCIGSAPYSIVSDPSKPVEEVDEVEKLIGDHEKTYGATLTGSVLRALNSKIDKLKGEK